MSQDQQGQRMETIRHGTNLRVAVIGVGAMGRAHCQTMREQVGEMDLAAVVDAHAATADEAGRQLGVPAFASVEAMLAAGVADASLIATPHPLHLPAVEACLEAGLHVLCEKPMATKLEDAHAMVEKAQKTGKRLMVHMNSRYRDSSLALGALAPAGQLGQVYYGRSSMIRRRSVPTIHFPPTGIMGRGPWFLDREEAGGGALMDIGVHAYDLMWWFMGCPKPVAVSASTFRMLYNDEAAAKGVKFDVDELASALVRYENGATAFVDVSWAAHSEPEWNVRVLGTEAGIMLNPPTVFRDRGGLLESTKVEVPEPLRVSAQQHFVDCIRDPNKTLISPGTQALEVVKVLDAIRRSAAAGKEVAIAE